MRPWNFCWCAATTTAAPATHRRPWGCRRSTSRCAWAALALCHHPQPRAGAYVLAGHLHPCVVLGGRAHQRLRLPCFHFGAQVGVLPAFGAFTGMHAVRPGPGERIYVVGDDTVQPLPRAENPTLTA